MDEMRMDEDRPDEFDDPKPRYRLCKVGFALSALGLGLLSADVLCLLAQFFGVQGLMPLRQSRAWHWLVGAPITWATLVGSYLLWGRWADAGWQRRSGLLVLMNSYDALNWLITNGHDLGLWHQEIPSHWLRDQVSQGFGWVEMILFASLATELSARLGRDDPPEAGRTARLLALAGLWIWAALLLIEVGFAAGWPPGRGGLPFREALLLLILLILLQAAASFQATILCARASRQCTQKLVEIDADDPANELLKSRSEQADDDLWR